jgi:3-O-alpha-D-mannopyranosyl-alpha-D-mannopyranose xylosylphosphotransferase
MIHRYIFAFSTASLPGWRPSIPLPSILTGAPSNATPPPPEYLYLDAEFPPASARQGQDALDSVSRLYRPFHPLPEEEAPFPVLRPTRFLPPKCLESWFADGELACSGEELGSEETLDVTWLWVNGTDKRWQQDMEYWSKKLGVHSPARHFR